MIFLSYRVGFFLRSCHPRWLMHEHLYTQTIGLTVTNTCINSHSTQRIHLHICTYWQRDGFCCCWWSLSTDIQAILRWHQRNQGKISLIFVYGWWNLGREASYTNNNNNTSTVHIEHPTMLWTYWWKRYSVGKYSIERMRIKSKTSLAFAI